MQKLARCEAARMLWKIAWALPSLLVAGIYFKTSGYGLVWDDTLFVNHPNYIFCNLNAIFLSMETPVSSGHVGALLLLEPLDDSGFDFERLRAQIETRLALVPRFSWKLKSIPFGPTARTGWRLKASIRATKSYAPQSPPLAR